MPSSKGTSPRSTRPLPSSRRRRKSAPSPTRTSSSIERRALSERPPRNEESQFPSPSISLRQLAESPSSRPRWPRLATIFLRSTHRLSSFTASTSEQAASIPDLCRLLQVPKTNAPPSSNRGVSNIGSVKSSRRIGEPRRRARAWRYQEPRGHRTPREGHRRRSGGFRHIISAGGQAVVSSRQNHDIKKQKTGVDLALKLPQIAPITTTPGVGSRQGQLILRL